MPLLIHEQTNLIVTDEGPDNSKHLTLSSVKLPTLDEVSQDYSAGGAIGEIAVAGLGLRKLEATFSVVGHDPQIMSQFGLGRRNRRPFTCYGLVRDKKSGLATEMKALLEGRIIRIEQSDLQRGELVSHDYMIAEIYHYELWLAQKEKFYYDFFTSDWRVDGLSQNDDARNILRIAGTS